MCQLICFSHLQAQFEQPNVSSEGNTVQMTDEVSFSFVLSDAIVPVLGCDEPIIRFPYTYVDPTKLAPFVDVQAKVYIESCCLTYLGNSNDWILEPMPAFIGNRLCLVYSHVVNNVSSPTLSTEIFPEFRFTQTGSAPRIIGVKYYHRDPATGIFPTTPEKTWLISSSANNITTIPDGTISTLFNSFLYNPLRNTGCNQNDPGGVVEYLIAGSYTVNEEICFYPLVGGTSNNRTPRKIYLNPGAEIIVASGGNLTVSGSQIRSCSRMGRGITVRSGGVLNLIGSSIKDCQFAVNAEPGSFVFLLNNDFKNNYVAINANFPTSNFFFHSIEGNSFNSDLNIKPAYIEMAQNISTVGYAGINLNNVEGFNISIPNNFTSLSNGIVGRNSNITAYNQSFVTLSKDNVYGVISGYGIYSNATGNSIKRLKVGSESLGANTFTGCGSAAIFGRKMTGNANFNTISNSNAGILWHESKNTKIAIEKNTITVKEIGISSYLNEPLLNAATTGITGNTISSLRGIKAAESGGIKDKGWLIDGNSIKQSGIESLGINYSGGVSGKVQNNKVNVSFENSVGIKLENTKTAYCGVNNLDGTDNSVGTAILATGNRSPYLQCNNSNLINTGIQVMDLNEGGVVETNSFNNYKVGLQYTGSTMMPPMLHRGNCWDNNKFSDVDASCESSIDADNSFYKVDLPSSLGEMACFMPLKVEPLGWFLSDITPEVTLTCSVLPPTGGLNTGKDEWDIKVATHNYQPEKYTESTVWRAEYRLYQKLLANPELVLQNSELSVFKTEKTGSNMNKLAIIESIKQDLYKLNTDEQTQLSILIDQRDTKADKFNMAHNDYVNNPSIGKAEINSSWVILQTKNTELESVLNAQHLVLVSQANNAQGLNSLLSTNTIWETNHKSVNEIYLRTIVENSELNANEITQLQSIAVQCPYEGGDAVYEARSILGFMDEDYDDRKICNLEDLRPNTLERGQEISQLLNGSSLFYPNPVNDLLYLNSKIMGAAVSVFDNLGVLIFEVNNVQSPISVASLESGLYNIKIQQTGKRAIFQKIIVTKL
jgi:rRNA-processing protein FCF1